MLNTKYLNNNNKIKKKVINLFIPMLFGLKMNKTLYNDNMYYKLFYLLFNHISLIEVFLKDKKFFIIFQNIFKLIYIYIYLKQI